MPKIEPKPNDVSEMTKHDGVELICILPLVRLLCYLSRVRNEHIFYNNMRFMQTIAVD